MKDMALDEWPAFHEKRMREVDELAKRDRFYRRDDPNARRLKDLSKAERDAIEGEVTALVKELMHNPSVIVLRQDGIK